MSHMNHFKESSVFTEMKAEFVLFGVIDKPFTFSKLEDGILFYDLTRDDTYYEIVFVCNMALNDFYLHETFEQLSDKHGIQWLSYKMLGTVIDEDGRQAEYVNRYWENNNQRK